MKKSTKVNINGTEMTIQKIPIGKFAELMMAVEKLPGAIFEVVSVDEIENLDTKILLNKLPQLLAKAQDEIFNLVSVASGIEKIENLSFEEFVDVVTAIVEVNNIQVIVNKLKNLGEIVKGKVK